MIMPTQEELKYFSLTSAEGNLCGREQAKAWALREVWQQEGKSPYGMLPFIAGKLRKTKDGKPTGEAPSKQAVEQLFDKLDSDPEWYPGKQSDTPRGPKRVLVGGKITGIVNACKRLRAEGDDATYSTVVARAKKATLNPNTGEPVDKKQLYRVFRERCYDEGAHDCWELLPYLAQTALDEPAIERRVVFAGHMKELRHTAEWYFRNVVWVDLCSSILPRTQRKAIALKAARKGNKAWMSKSKRHKSANRRVPANAAKINSSDTVRVWFVPVLTRGKLHIEPLSANFPCETPEGAAEMVAAV